MRGGEQIDCAGTWATSVRATPNFCRPIDNVTGRRCTFAFFPWNWDRGDGCIIRLVAIVDPKGAYRIEKGERFA